VEAVWCRSTSSRVNCLGQLARDQSKAACSRWRLRRYSRTRNRSHLSCAIQTLSNQCLPTRASQTSPLTRSTQYM